MVWPYMQLQEKHQYVVMLLLLFLKSSVILNLQPRAGSEEKQVRALVCCKIMVEVRHFFHCRSMDLCVEQNH